MVGETQKRLFLSRIKRAHEIARQKGAVLNEAVVTAMAALESAWGTSYLAKAANNILGIKAGTSWKGEVIALKTQEYLNGKPITISAYFRKYPSWNLCLVDFSDIISKRWFYRDALKYLNEPDLFLQALLPAKNKPGYATDPNYFAKVKEVAKEIERLGGPPWYG